MGSVPELNLGPHENTAVNDHQVHSVDLDMIDQALQKPPAEDGDDVDMSDEELIRENQGLEDEGGPSKTAPQTEAKTKPKADGPGKVVYLPSSSVFKFCLSVSESEMAQINEELAKTLSSTAKGPTSLQVHVEEGYKFIVDYVSEQAVPLLAGNVKESTMQDMVEHITSAGQVAAWYPCFPLVKEIVVSEINTNRKLPLTVGEVLALLGSLGGDTLRHQIQEAIKRLMVLTLSELTNTVQFPRVYVPSLGDRDQNTSHSDNEDMEMDNLPTAQKEVDTATLGECVHTIPLNLQKYCPAELIKFCITHGLSCLPKPGRERKNNHRRKKIVVTPVGQGKLGRSWTREGKGKNRNWAIKNAGTKMFKDLKREYAKYHLK
ncbi:hypothetical protein TWF506_004727 [Arthrobotrys conoides]|uniref:Uncharacterized protein n=1 Tax=Arthrobotrys conoides TaxID=74498 RepID=A0AAN8RP91_9PEZI